MTKTRPTMTQPYDAYIRVSQVGKRQVGTDGTADDTEAGKLISPELQLSKIRAYANAHGHTIRENPPELDVSGKKMARPILDEILQRVRNGESRGLIVSKLNRFARTLIGGLSVIAELHEAGGQFIAVDQQFDMSSPMGKTVLVLMLRMAEQDLEQISGEWEDSQRNAIANGLWIASAVPPGYDKRPDRRLYPNKHRETVRKAFLMRAEHHSTGEIAEFWNSEMPRSDGTLWLPTTVRQLLESRGYRGESIRGEMKNSKAHEPLVTEAEWQAAQVTVRSQPRTKNEVLLTGLIRCAGCRYAMTPTYAENRRKGEIVKVPIYRCRGKSAHGDCPTPSTISRETIDDYVEAAFLEQVKGAQVHAHHSSRDFDAAVTHVEELETELDEFIADTTVRKMLGDAAYHAAVQARIDKLAVGRKELVGLQGPLHSLGRVEWETLTIAEKRRTLSESLDVIFIRPGKNRRSSPAAERALILWSGEFKDKLPSRNGRNNGPVHSVTW